MKVLMLVLLVGAGCGSGVVGLDGNDADGGPPRADADPDAPDARPGTPDGRPPDRPDSGPLPPQTTRLRVVSQCEEPIWIAHSDNLADSQNVKLERGGYHDYVIPEAGVPSVRIWPKLGCNDAGAACRIGDTGEGGGAPCSGPCQPPIDSKMEITFAPVGGPGDTFYNLSMVDGYTIPLKIRPVGNGAEQGSCVTSDCSDLTPSSCPVDEDMSGGGLYPAYASVDLRVLDTQNGNRPLGCLSPCKKWNYSSPYGLSQPEGEDPGLHMCCPTPFTDGRCTAENGCIGPDACRSLSDPLGVERTKYVEAVRRLCPSAYSYSYDDAQGLHACPPTTHFEVTFCP